MLVQGDKLAECERVSATPKMEVVGRLPVNTRAGTISSGVPSARTSSAVLPKAESLGLCEVVAEEQLVHVLVAVLGRVRGVHERDEVGRDQLGA